MNDNVIGNRAGPSVLIVAHRTRTRGFCAGRTMMFETLEQQIVDGREMVIGIVVERLQRDILHR